MASDTWRFTYDVQIPMEDDPQTVGVKIAHYASTELGGVRVVTMRGDQVKAPG